MENILNVEELDEFNVEEDVLMAQKYLKVTANIIEYDAERLLHIVSGVMKEKIKKRTLSKIMRAIVKNVPPEKPEESLRWLLSKKKIKKWLLSLLNKQGLKKWSLKVKDANIERDQNNVLNILAKVEILNFDDLLNEIKKLAVKKAPKKYKDILETGLEVLNSEVEEEMKATFVYNILESNEFQNILEEVKKDIVLLIEEVLQDGCKLSVKLQNIHLEVVEKEIH